MEHAILHAFIIIKYVCFKYEDSKAAGNKKDFKLKFAPGSLYNQDANHCKGCSNGLESTIGKVYADYIVEYVKNDKSKKVDYDLDKGETKKIIDTIKYKLKRASCSENNPCQ
ncbi:hypothetical protein [Lactobacillus sp. Sy-1]|uniref:hypothetical protein n=1 Tax=Lactobacillus sp. Sy-1 TaxID=2109645 RepID=UPI001C5B8289|nr:hypothetical protein [Lactobacillus sp. Sy-1]MBW1606329.1 hypothetical protein [Lactobacillus sp. Sy-1]